VPGLSGGVDGAGAGCGGHRRHGCIRACAETSRTGQGARFKRNPFPTSNYRQDGQRREAAPTSSRAVGKVSAPCGDRKADCPSAGGEVPGCGWCKASPGYREASDAAACRAWGEVANGPAREGASCRPPSVETGRRRWCRAPQGTFESCGGSGDEAAFTASRQRTATTGQTRGRAEAARRAQGDHEGRRASGAVGE
jgi:hypothetical protein